MYLSAVEIENFRIFGAKQEGKHLALELSPGLNLLVGENDSGKTCFIDALRLVLGTAPAEYFTLDPEDFHCQHGQRATALRISIQVLDLSLVEAAAFLEFLEVTQVGGVERRALKITYSATRDESVARGSRRSPVRWEVRAGAGQDGQRFEGPARELLRATYLKPLRDAVGELAAKRNSRLSQILSSYPQIRGQEVNDWNPNDPVSVPHTLVGFAARAEHEIRNSPVVTQAEQKLNDAYLKPFSLGPHPLAGRITMSPQELRHLLERMELTLADHEPGATRGLGHHNVLFMAAELLALERDDDPSLPLVLIEEPEAHLHPQLQLRLVEFFREQTKVVNGKSALQVILTSHSPNIASKVGLRQITMMHRGRGFALRPDVTLLEESDYEFLERFLDVTRAELLFAKGLLIVEGDAEAILLPTIADLIGKPLTANGVSVINVGSTGLFRYARILQRRDGETVPVRVACVADRDIPPAEARQDLPATRRTVAEMTAAQIDAQVARIKDRDGGAVRTFVSDAWTLEYDLALHGLGREMHVAVSLAVASKSKRRALSVAEYREILRKALGEYRGWQRANVTAVNMAVSVYRPLLMNRASKAETAQYLARLLRQRRGRRSLQDEIPRYIVSAIEYATGQQVAEDAEAADAVA